MLVLNPSRIDTYDTCSRSVFDADQEIATGNVVEWNPGKVKQLGRERLTDSDRS